MGFCHSRCYTINLLFLCTSELSLTTDHPPHIPDNTTVSIKCLMEFKYGDFHWPNIPSSTIAREVRICLKSWRVQGSALTGTGLWLLLSGLMFEGLLKVTRMSVVNLEIRNRPICMSTVFLAASLNLETFCGSFSDQCLGSFQSVQ